MTDVVVSDDVEAIAALAVRRGVDCEVAGLPVITSVLVANADDEVRFGALAILPATVDAASAATAFREVNRRANDRLWFTLATLSLAFLLLCGLCLFLFVTSTDHAAARQREADAYAEYASRFGWQQPGPAECRTEAEFAALETALQTSLAPPAAYRWDSTPAGSLYRKWQTDAALAKPWRNRIAEEFRQRAYQASVLQAARPFDAAAAQKLIAEVPRYVGPVPGSLTLSQKRGTPLLLENILTSDVVEQARSQWHDAAWRLTGWPQLRAILIHGVGLKPFALVK